MDWRAATYFSSLRTKHDLVMPKWWVGPSVNRQYRVFFVQTSTVTLSMHRKHGKESLLTLRWEKAFKFAERYSRFSFALHVGKTRLTLRIKNTSYPISLFAGFMIYLQILLCTKWWSHGLIFSCKVIYLCHLISWKTMFLFTLDWRSQPPCQMRSWTQSWGCWMTMIDLKVLKMWQEAKKSVVVLIWRPRSNELPRTLLSQIHVSLIILL